MGISLKPKDDLDVDDKPENASEWLEEASQAIIIGIVILLIIAAFFFIYIEAVKEPALEKACKGSPRDWFDGCPYTSTAECLEWCKDGGSDGGG